MPETARATAWSAAWGAVAVVLGGCAAAAWTAAVSPGSRIPTWPAWAFGALTAIAVYMCFALLSGRWLARRRSRRGRPTFLPEQPPPGVDLIPEQAGYRLRIGLLNRRSAAEYSAQVTAILDPLGRPIGPQHWPIPWLEDGSPEPKRILTGQTRMLDFARCDLAAVNAELCSGHGTDAHWWFSSVPVPIGARYYNLRSQEDLADQHIMLTVRIMNANSGDYFDRELQVGLNGPRITCVLAVSVSD
jgi:hypothetical protein